MRFRARIARERFASFWNYIAPLDKVGKEAVLVLSKDSLRLIVLPPGETVMLYSSVIADRALFQEFRVESKAGSIALQVVVANLEQGLQPALEGRAELVTLKLTKRGASPYLMVDIREPEANGGASTAQDVPVKLLTAAEAERYAEPSLNFPSVRLRLPSASKVLALLERMRSISKHVRVVGNMGARGSDDCASLTLSADNEALSMQAFFNNLPAEAGLGLSQEGAGQAEALVGTRDLLRCLKAVCALPVPADWLLGLVPQQALFLHAQMGDGSGSVTYVVAIVDAGLGGGSGGGEPQGGEPPRPRQGQGRAQGSRAQAQAPFDDDDGDSAYGGGGGYDDCSGEGGAGAGAGTKAEAGPGSGAWAGGDNGFGYDSRLSIGGAGAGAGLGAGDRSGLSATVEGISLGLGLGLGRSRLSEGGRGCEGGDGGEGDGAAVGISIDNSRLLAEAEAEGVDRSGDRRGTGGRGSGGGGGPRRPAQGVSLDESGL